MRPNFYLLFAHTLLLLGLIVPMNSVTAGVPDELRTKLDEVEALSADIRKLVEEEGMLVREMQTTTNQELELQLRTQHQEILQKIGKKNELQLRTLHEAVDLLKGYVPASPTDREAVTRQTERIVTFLKGERDGILGDPDAPDKLIIKLGIDKLLANADDHLRLLRSKEEKYPPRKDGAPPGTRQDGFMAWFDSQDTAVKAALIAAIVSIIGTLATVVVAAIRRRD